MLKIHFLDPELGAEVTRLGAMSWLEMAWQDDVVLMCP
jgi:hypothetical protein